MIRKICSIVGASALLVGTAISGGPVTTAYSENIYTTMEVQAGPTWGLDRIDGTANGSYEYLSDGVGVRIYIVDTGVDATHSDFSGRVLDGFDAFNQNLDQADCNGHGTHIAGIVGGSIYGVAKAATIVPVRVLNCSGQGTTSTLTAGISWILRNHPAGKPAIINMSLGGPKDDAVNAATSRLIEAGMIVIAAAGNATSDACTFSPASTPGVISVGSVNEQDARSPFSNWGDCIDIFAPGSKITSSAMGGRLSQKSGTSQAAAFVSGAMATYVSAGYVSNYSGALNAINSFSQKSVVSDSRSRASDLLNVAKVVADTPIVIPVSPLPESPVVTMAIDKSISSPGKFTIKYNKLTWTRPTYSSSYARVTYVVQQYVSDKWVTIAETGNLMYALPRGSTTDSSIYRVLAKTPKGFGPATDGIRNSGASAANLITPPVLVAPPTNSSVVATQRGGAGSSVGDITWTPVTGATKYDVEISNTNGESWLLLRSTTGTSIKFVAGLTVQYLLKVSVTLSDGSKKVIGIVGYQGM
jgi:subtilisin family serine protease